MPQMYQEGVPPSQIRTGGSGTDYPEIRLIHPDEYELIKEKARKNLTKKELEEFGEALGL